MLRCCFVVCSRGWRTSAAGTPSGGRHWRSTSCSRETSFPKGSWSKDFRRSGKYKHADISVVYRSLRSLVPTGDAYKFITRHLLLAAHSSKQRKQDKKKMSTVYARGVKIPAALTLCVVLDDQLTKWKHKHTLRTNVQKHFSKVNKLCFFPMQPKSKVTNLVS